MIQVNKISFSHGREPLYEEASFCVNKGNKAGLMGLNGAGKSTLFDLLIRKEWPDEGKIRVEGKIMMVPQEVSTDPVQQKYATVREYLLDARQNKDNILLQLLHNLEMDNVALTDNPSELSGGQKTKLAILHAVLAEPDILLLDEPTNFMDIAGKKWVMHWLSNYKKTLVVISHDLKLLDQHIDKIIYINKTTKKFEEYTGTYSKFVKLKAQRDSLLLRYLKNQEIKLKRMKKSAEKLKQSKVERVVHQGIILERRIARIEDSLPPNPVELVKIKMVLPVPSPVGELPVNIENVGKSYGDKQVLTKIDLALVRGHRYALIGHNGAGKSTLIKTIMNIISPDKGRVVIDPRAKIGYYSQEFEALDENLTLNEIVKQNTDMSENHIRGVLAKFMFGNQRINQKIYTLSGGEKTRLAIALLMLNDNNLLVLDEPTTYLDVLSQRIILEALKQYRGTMLIVSHTSDFLRELKPDRALLLPEERLVFWDNSLLDRTAEI
jgi:ATPase subunit of ABC transporter with duplicated ATPase domains